MCNSNSGARAQDLRILTTVAMALAPLPGDSLIRSPDDGWSAVRQRHLPLPLGSRWGHLTLQECTAFGSFGTVYRASDSRLHIDVALKLTNSARPNHELDSRLLQEATRLSRVRHGGIVKMYGAAIKRGRAGV